MEKSCSLLLVSQKMMTKNPNKTKHPELKVVRLLAVIAEVRQQAQKLLVGEKNPQSNPISFIPTEKLAAKFPAFVRSAKRFLRVHLKYAYKISK